MPWAWDMAQWCHDPVASGMAGDMRFRLPYPNQGNWRDEQTWNKFLVDAMRYVMVADRVFSMDPEKWDKAENNFYRLMVEGLDNAK